MKARHKMGSADKITVTTRTIEVKDRDAINELRTTWDTRVAEAKKDPKNTPMDIARIGAIASILNVLRRDLRAGEQDFISQQTARADRANLSPFEAAREVVAAQEAFQFAVEALCVKQQLGALVLPVPDDISSMPPISVPNPN